MNEFDYQRPTSLADARAALAQPGARILAGGTDLIVQLRERRRDASILVDLKHVAEMCGVSELADGTWSVGAAASASALLRDERLIQRYPALAISLGMIGSRLIQNRATLGGNVCNAAPSADAVPPLICYRAVCHLTGSQGSRRVPLEEIFVGPGRTNLAADEVLVAIELPAPPANSGAHYIRFTPRREMDIAVVGAGAWIAVDDAGKISDARVALASVAPTPIRSSGAEAALVGQAPGDDTFAAAAEAAAKDATPISDTRGSANYRKDLVRTLTGRSLRACATQIQA